MSDKLELDWGTRTRPGESESPASALKRRALPPGHPEAMPDGLRFRVQPFFTDSILHISQAIELAQAIVGWDQANAYDVKGEQGMSLFSALEEPRGLLGGLSRNFNPFYKNITDCVTTEGSRFLRLTFPFTFFFRRCEVLAWDDRPLGVVQMRFHLLKLRADILSPTGAVLLEIHGPMLKLFSFTDWVFEVRRGAQVVARIKKHWSGFFREAFTTSDRLSVEFGPELTDPRLRLLIFAAALTVDAASFEKKNRQLSGGNLASNVLDLLD